MSSVAITRGAHTYLYIFLKSVIFRMSMGGFERCTGTWGVLEAEMSVGVNKFCSSKNRCYLFVLLLGRYAAYLWY